MLTEILNELKSDGISVTNSKRTLKKSGQKEVYYIIVDNVEYILKIPIHRKKGSGENEK